MQRFSDQIRGDLKLHASSARLPIFPVAANIGSCRVQNVDSNMDLATQLNRVLCFADDCGRFSCENLEKIRETEASAGSSAADKLIEEILKWAFGALLSHIFCVVM